MKDVIVESLSQLIKKVKADTASWTRTGTAKPWFRGHSDTSYSLLPSILRPGNEKSEVDIALQFRLMAPGYSDVPETGRIDQWLFLMQHHGVPTRLLDWTENAFYALLFAVRRAADPDTEIENDAAVYAVDPIAINRLSKVGYFPNTWVQSSVLQTIKIAFGTEKELVDGTQIPCLEVPISIYPSTIHSRLRNQRACFTLHGTDKRSIEAIAGEALAENGCIVKYIIPKQLIPHFLADLYDLGVTESLLFPDLDGLSRDLRYRFRIRS